MIKFIQVRAFDSPGAGSCLSLFNGIGCAEAVEDLRPCFNISIDLLWRVVGESVGWLKGK